MAPILEFDEHLANADDGFGFIKHNLAKDATKKATKNNTTDKKAEAKKANSISTTDKESDKRPSSDEAGEVCVCSVLGETKKQVSNAFKSANVWDLSEQEIDSVLEILFKTLDGIGKEIELDDYRIVIETYFAKELKSLGVSFLDEGLGSKDNMVEEPAKETNENVCTDINGNTVPKAEDEAKMATKLKEEVGNLGSFRPGHEEVEEPAKETTENVCTDINGNTVPKAEDEAKMATKLKEEVGNLGSFRPGREERRLRTLRREIQKLPPVSPMEEIVRSQESLSAVPTESEYAKGVLGGRPQRYLITSWGPWDSFKAQVDYLVWSWLNYQICGEWPFEDGFPDTLKDADG